MRQWFVVRSKPRKEVVTSATLAKMGIEIYLPTLRSRAVRAGVAGAEPLFPGYLFSRLDPHSSDVAVVNRTAGVHYVLSCGDEPCAVPDVLVSTIRQRLAAGSRGDFVGTFRPGEPILIIRGPFQGIEAVFDKYLSPTGRVCVLIKTLQTVYRAQLDVNDLHTTRKVVERARA